MSLVRDRRARAGVLLWLVLAVPPISHLLQSTMTVQMIVQIPILVAVGWLISRAIPRRIHVALSRWDTNGVAGLLFASFAGALWMLPRMMDASVSDVRVAIAKWVSVPLLVGVPIAMSWPRAGFVLRGVFLLEAVATAFRLGWLYDVSPVRLCSNYLMDDQKQLGRYLLVLGAVACAVLLWKLVWGHIRVESVSPEQIPTKRHANDHKAHRQNGDKHDTVRQPG